MNRTSLFEKYDWPGWKLKDNKFGSEFDLAARERMVKGCRELLVFIKKYEKKLGKKVLEIGPFFDPLIKSSREYSVYYLDRDKFVLNWLRSNGQKVYGIDLNKRFVLPSSFFNSVIVSQVFNYIDYEKLLKKINGSLADGGLLLVNNVANYGIKELFHKNRPKSSEQTIGVIKSTGFDILAKKVVEFRVRNKKFRRLLIAAQKNNGSLNISGKVIHGDHFGKKLGFPTANLDRREYVRKKMKIRFGVWAGSVEIKNFKLKIKNYPAGIVIGPVDDQKLPKIEAHLLNFKGNLYGKKIAISLDKYIRPFRKFSSTYILKQQIRKDLKTINYYNKSRP